LLLTKVVVTFCCTDWFNRLSNKCVEWEGRHGTASALPFDGIPYMVIGRMVLECAAGRPHSRKPTLLVCFFVRYCAVAISRKTTVCKVLVNAVSLSGTIGSVHSDDNG